MVIIQDLSDTKFSFNGVPYFKNFTPIVRGDKTMIVNTYDSKIRLNELEDFSEYQVDGNTFTNVEDLQNALLPVVFVRSSLGGASGGSLDLNDLGDVNITSLTDGDGIYFDSTTNRWVNAPNQNTVPVENRYDTNVLMTADYANQSIGLFQFVEDARTASEINNGTEPYSAYYEYLGDTNNDLTDYNKLSDTDVQLITNTPYNSFIVKNVIAEPLTETSIYSGISFAYNPATSKINQVVFNPTFSKYLLDYIGDVNDLTLQIWNNTAGEKKLLFATIEEINFTNSTEVFIEAKLKEEIDFNRVNALDSIVIDISRGVKSGVIPIDVYENIPLEVGVYSVTVLNTETDYKLDINTNVFNYSDNSQLVLSDFLSNSVSYAIVERKYKAVDGEIDDEETPPATPKFVDTFFDSSGEVLGNINVFETNKILNINIDTFNRSDYFKNRYIVSDLLNFPTSKSYYYGFITINVTEYNYVDGLLTVPYELPSSTNIIKCDLFIGKEKISNYEIGLISSETDSFLGIKDLSGSFLSSNSKELSIIIEYRQTLNYGVGKRLIPFDNNLLDVVMNFETETSHSNKMTTWFSESYGGFAGTIINASSPELSENIESSYINKFVADNNIGFIFSAGSGASMLANNNVGDFPSPVTLGSNSLIRIDRTSSVSDFQSNVIYVTARAETDNDGTDPLGTSYGFGAEFNEPTLSADLIAGGYTDNAIGTEHEQSPATAIVAGKLKFIKDQTGATWDIVRQAARQTASNANTYNIYRGFGKIDTAAAIALIPTLEAAKSLALAEYYEQTTVMPLGLKYEDKKPNTSVNKRDLLDVLDNIDAETLGGLSPSDFIRKSGVSTQTIIGMLGLGIDFTAKELLHLNSGIASTDIGLQANGKGWRIRNDQNDNEFRLAFVSGEDFDVFTDRIVMLKTGAVEFSGAVTAPSFIGSGEGLTPTTTINTNTTIELNNVLGNYCNMASANTNATFTTSNDVTGGKASVLINRATPPTVTGATLIKGSEFIASTDMYLKLENNGNRTEYWFEQILA